MLPKYHEPDKGWMVGYHPVMYYWQIMEALEGNP